MINQKKTSRVQNIERVIVGIEYTVHNCLKDCKSEKGREKEKKHNVLMIKGNHRTRHVD